MLRLFKDLEPLRAERVAARAIAIGALTYKSIASIIANKLDRAHPPKRPNMRPSSPTLDQLQALGLHGMAKGFKDLMNQPETHSLDHTEWLALLLAQGATLRRQKKYESRARAAKLCQAATVEDVDYRAFRGLDHALFLKLARSDWVRAKHNLLITGPCESES